MTIPTNPASINQAPCQPPMSMSVCRKSGAIANPPETKTPEIPDANPRRRSNHLAIIVREAIVSIPWPLKRSIMKPSVSSAAATRTGLSPPTTAVSLRETDSSRVSTQSVAATARQATIPVVRAPCRSRKIPPRGRNRLLASVPTRYVLASSSRDRPVTLIRWSVNTLTPIVCPGTLITIPSVATPTMTQP